MDQLLGTDIICRFLRASESKDFQSLNSVLAADASWNLSFSDCLMDSIQGIEKIWEFLLSFQSFVIIDSPVMYEIDSCHIVHCYGKSHSNDLLLGARVFNCILWKIENQKILKMVSLFSGEKPCL